MFIQPCFIRKNTLKIQEKLEDLGYKNYLDYTANCKIIFVYQHPIKSFDVPCYTIADSFDLPYADGSALKNKFIDCETNEDLFLALAALRDDSDYMQYFVCADYFVLCDRDDWLDMYSVLHCGHRYSIEALDNAHKATVEELIEYFKE